MAWQHNTARTRPNRLTPIDIYIVIVDVIVAVIIIHVNIVFVDIKVNFDGIARQDCIGYAQSYTCQY